MLLQRHDVGVGMESQLVILCVINSKLVRMTIGYFICLREKKAINLKIRVSYRVRMKVKSSLKYVIFCTLP